MSCNKNSAWSLYLALVSCSRAQISNIKYIILYYKYNISFCSELLSCTNIESIGRPSPLESITVQ